MKQYAWNQGANTGYRKQKCLTPLFLKIADISKYELLKLKFRIPKEADRGVLECLLSLWFADTTMKGKYFWLKLADLPLCM